MIRSLRNSTGSGRVSGSTSTKPAGTSTPQRRQPVQRPREHHGGGHGDDERDHADHPLLVGEEQDRHAERSRQEQPGHGEWAEEQSRRRAEEHTLLVAVRQRVGRCERESWPDTSTSAATVATTAPIDARVEGAVDHRGDRRDRERGAITRTAVSESGRGASTASSPAAHATHRSTSATSSGASAHPAAGHRGPSGERERHPHDSQCPEHCRSRANWLTQDHSVHAGRGSLRARAQGVRIVRAHDADRPSAGTRPRIATGVGSLPHTDEAAAAELVLRGSPRCRLHRSPGAIRARA